MKWRGPVKASSHLRLRPSAYLPAPCRVRSTCTYLELECCCCCCCCSNGDLQS